MINTNTQIQTDAKVQNAHKYRETTKRDIIKNIEEKIILKKPETDAKSPKFMLNGPKR